VSPGPRAANDASTSGVDPRFTDSAEASSTEEPEAKVVDQFKIDEEPTPAFLTDLEA